MKLPLPGIKPLFMLMVLCTTLFSCSKNDDNTVEPSLNKSLLYGLWEVKGLYRNGVDINCYSEECGGTSNMGIAELKEEEKPLYMAEGSFSAAMNVKFNNSISFLYLHGYYNVINGSTLRVQHHPSKSYTDVKIKKLSASELIVEFAYEGLGTLEARCVPM